MANAYAPTAQAETGTGPTIVPAYPVVDVDGRWKWSDEGPADAGVITDTDGRITISTGAASTWRAVMGANGSPRIFGG